MNINILEDVKDSCRRANQEGLSQSKKESYAALASQFNRLIGTIEDQTYILKNMIALSEETGNYSLMDALQSLCYRLNQEMDLIEDSKNACKCAGN